MHNLQTKYMRLSDNGCENVEQVYTSKTFRGPFKTVILKYINLKTHG